MAPCCADAPVPQVQDNAGVTNRRGEQEPNFCLLVKEAHRRSGPNRSTGFSGSGAFFRQPQSGITPGVQRAGRRQCCRVKFAQIVTWYPAALTVDSAIRLGWQSCPESSSSAGESSNDSFPPERAESRDSQPFRSRNPFVGSERRFRSAAHRCQAQHTDVNNISRNFLAAFCIGKKRLPIRIIIA